MREIQKYYKIRVSDKNNFRKGNADMQLLLKDEPILDIQENGTCRILDFDRLPFALRKENVTFVDFI